VSSVGEGRGNPAFFVCRKPPGYAPTFPFVPGLPTLTMEVLYQLS
jgi:hypothetical protein